MKCEIVRIWATTQIILGIAIVVSTAHYAPPAFEKMRDEAQRTGANLCEISDTLVAWRTTYAEFATNLFVYTHEMKGMEEQLLDAGVKTSDLGHVFQKRGQEFEKSERHYRESKIIWGTMGMPFANSIANVYGELKGWSLTASTNLFDVGRDLVTVATVVEKMREGILKYQEDSHPKTLQTMATSSVTIGHVGEMLTAPNVIDTLRRSVFILCGVIALLFIGNGVVLFVASTLGGAFSTPDRRPPAA